MFFNNFEIIHFKKEHLKNRFQSYFVSRTSRHGIFHFKSPALDFLVL